MNKDNFKRGISYSKDKQSEELQELKEERKKLLARSDELNSKIDELQKERTYVNTILMRWHNNRTIDKKELEIQKINAIREAINTLGKEQNDLRVALRNNRKRIEELQGTYKATGKETCTIYPSL